MPRMAEKSTIRWPVSLNQHFIYKHAKMTNDVDRP